MKIFVATFCLFLVLVASGILYQSAKTQSVYQGLPTVPCLDYTKPIVQKFSFTITLHILGKSYPIDKMIGHDAGNCLHDIFAKDTSGTIFVETNDTQRFTLGQFFDVWHRTFSKTQLFGYLTDKTHHIQIRVNNKIVNTYRTTVLSPDEAIDVIYQ